MDSATLRRMIPSLDTLAGDNAALRARIREARRLLHRRALVGAAASAVPVPGLDWAVDAALLARLVPAINHQFGLTPQQLDALPHHQRDQVQQAISAIGATLVGKFITKDLVLRMAQGLGMRLTAKQAAKFVPLAGQAVSALAGYAMVRYLGEAHIRDCVRVVREVGLSLPPPEGPQAIQP